MIETLIEYISNSSIRDIIIMLSASYAMTKLFNKYKIILEVLKEIGEVIDTIQESYNDDDKIDGKEFKKIFKEIGDVIKLVRKKKGNSKIGGIYGRIKEGVSKRIKPN